jgi:hypothetical protein
MPAALLVHLVLVADATVAAITRTPVPSPVIVSILGFSDEEGSLGWVLDAPKFGFPDGSSFDCRVSAFARKEGDTWKLVHAHFSIRVPDEEVVKLQKKWS